MSATNISYKLFRKIQDDKHNNPDNTSEYEFQDYESFIAEELNKVETPKELMDTMIASFGRSFEKEASGFVYHSENYKVIKCVFDFLYYQEWAGDVIHFVKGYIGVEWALFSPYVFSNLKNGSSNMSLNLGFEDELDKLRGLEPKPEEIQNIFTNFRSNIMHAYQKALIAFCNRDSAFFSNFSQGEGSNLNHIDRYEASGEGRAWLDRTEMNFIVSKEFNGFLYDQSNFRTDYNSVCAGKMVLTASVTFKFSWPENYKYQTTNSWNINVDNCNCIKFCKINLSVDSDMWVDSGYSKNIFNIEYEPTNSYSERDLGGLIIDGVEGRTYLQSVNAILHLLQRPNPISMVTYTDTDFLVLSYYKHGGNRLKICVDHEKLVECWKSNCEKLREAKKENNGMTYEMKKDHIRWCIRNQEIMCELFEKNMLRDRDDVIVDKFIDMGLEPPDLKRVTRNFDNN